MYRFVRIYKRWLLELSQLNVNGESVLDLLLQYGVFLAEVVTIVVAIVIVLVTIVGLSTKGRSETGTLMVTNLSEEMNDVVLSIKEQVLTKEQFKALEKNDKKEAKAEKKNPSNKPKLYVLDFNGSLHATEVAALRKEVTAVVQIATPEDKVLVRLESPGGVVHGYGLAASQLKRIVDRDISLTIAVDKVAASGGYMMACIADKIIAAPFSIIGSIGVIAQVPNFHKILKKNDIEFEQVTAGEFKRTLTMFGENTAKNREKFQQEIDETHELFKQHVSESRPTLDIDKVATGEHWYGNQAIGLGLVDEITTSDDYLLKQLEENEIFHFKYTVPKTLSEKLGKAASLTVEQSLTSVWSRLSQWRGF